MRASIGLVCAILLLLASAGQAGAASVSITGPEQIVYDWSTMACATDDWPDGMGRAFRDANGQVQIIRSSPKNRRMIGADFDHLTNDCTIVKGSAHDPFPGRFDDRTWLSPHTLNGSDVFALLHNEYHGSSHPGMCPSGIFFSCRYNAVTFAKSTNGGDSYTSPPSPTHLVASLPYPYEPDGGRFGVFGPSNIIEKDGFYYATVLISAGYREQRPGVCLMRTKDVSDPASWRAWDGAGFTVRFINPYLEPSARPAAHTCHPISHDQIDQLPRNLTYNSYLDKYFMIGTDIKFDPARQEGVRGIYYSFSDDLIHWTETQFLIESPLCVPGGAPGWGGYPSVIDPASTDRNFGRSGRTAYLYFVRFNNAGACGFTNDRDALRVPIEFAL
jgi:hypothetical protein